jgi:hypothetical protein
VYVTERKQIRLTPDAQADAAMIQRYYGLASVSAAIRFALREVARQVSESASKSPSHRPSSDQEQEHAGEANEE